jgi:hypothetical protein
MSIPEARFPGVASEQDAPRGGGSIEIAHRHREREPLNITMIFSVEKMGKHAVARFDGYDAKRATNCL